MWERLPFGHLPRVVIVVQYEYFVVYCCVGYQQDAIVCSIEAVACGFESDEAIERLASH